MRFSKKKFFQGIAKELNYKMVGVSKVSSDRNLSTRAKRKTKGILVNQSSRAERDAKGIFVNL